MIDYTIILSRRYAGEEWILNGDEYSGLIWLSESSKPEQSTLDSLWVDVQAEVAAEVAAKTTARQALLEKLGITEEEAQLLLGGN